MKQNPEVFNHFYASDESELSLNLACIEVTNSSEVGRNREELKKKHNYCNTSWFTVFYHCVSKPECQ